MWSRLEETWQTKSLQEKKDWIYSHKAEATSSSNIMMSYVQCNNKEKIGKTNKKWRQRKEHNITKIILKLTLILLKAKCEKETEIFTHAALTNLTKQQKYKGWRSPLA